MTTLTFDTHSAAKNLRQAGFTEAQTEALIKLEKEKDTGYSATKADLDKATADLKIWTLTMMLGQTAVIIGLLKLL